MPNPPPRTKTNKWFITISAYNSGDGLDDVAIDELRSYIVSMSKTSCPQHCLVLEQYNRKRQTFKHLHLYLEKSKEQTQDNIRKNWLKVLKDKNLYNNKKDLDVRGAVNPYVLVGGYLTKTDDYEILSSTLSPAFVEKSVQMAKSYERRVCVLKGMKCPTLNEAPYSFEIFINSNNLEYDGTPHSFKSICYLMIKSREFALGSLLGKMSKVKALLDILYLDDPTYFNHLLDNEFEKEDHNHYTKVYCDCQEPEQFHGPHPKPGPPPPKTEYKLVHPDCGDPNCKVSEKCGWKNADSQFTLELS